MARRSVLSSLRRRIERRLQLSLLRRSSPERWVAAGKARLLPTFRAALRTAGYRTILEDAGVDDRAVRTIEDFQRAVPLTTKATTFGRFPLTELAVPGTLDRISGVLTSSGHGNSGFAFGLSSARERARMSRAVDLGLEMAFRTDQLRTLAINCLPMGVRFSSDAVCVADVSVREDMALAIIEGIGTEFDQIILFGDPLFMKKLVDYAAERGFDWSTRRVSVVLGEEAFGEAFRRYLAARMHINNDPSSGGWIASSFGIGELGLNLMFESPLLAALRAGCVNAPDVLEELLGAGISRRLLPTFFHYDPMRMFVEIVDPDDTGFGTMAITMLDQERVIPMIRYATGDVARILSTEQVSSMCARLGLDPLSAPRLPVLALLGRTKDRLRAGRFITHYQDLLYAEPVIADRITGAFQYRERSTTPELRVQLRRGQLNDAGLADYARRCSSECEMQFVNYEDFRDVLSLDYERKFTYVCE